MPRPEKVEAVAEITERIDGAQAVFLAEYAGLSVKAQQELRRGLRAQGAEFKVVKMTLARRAAEALELSELNELLTGPTGVTYADGDPVGTAKVLKEFAKTHETFIVKGGLLGGNLLSPERVSELAEIAPREVLLAKLAGAMKAPMAKMAGVLTALPRNAASVFQQLLEQKEAAAPAASEAPAPEAAEDPAPAETEDTAPVADAAPADDTATAEDSAPAEDSASAEDGAEAPAEAEQETAAEESAAETPVAEDSAADSASEEPTTEEPTEEPAAAGAEASGSNDDDQAVTAEEE